MAKIQELKIKSGEGIYREIAEALVPYKEEPQGSHLFIVEGTKNNPTVALRYPGKKVQRRSLKVERANSAKWGNLYDFEVVPYVNGKEAVQQKFTFDEILKDFQEHKRDNQKFWELIEEVYYKNTFNKKEVPKLFGIDPTLYLLMLKWIWIQEDFNYRLSWGEVGSQERYILTTRTGTPTSKGAGRAKFYAALILLKHHFDFKTVKKIIPLY